MFNTVLVIIKLTKFPVPVGLCCGSGKLNFCHILIRFALFKNVVHRLKRSKLCVTSLNIAKHFKQFVTVAIPIGGGGKT